jgi:hypothetical protein
MAINITGSDSTFFNALLVCLKSFSEFTDTDEIIECGCMIGIVEVDALTV